MTGAELRSVLKDLGIRQVWLGEKLGVAPNTVSRWAKGELPVPQYAVAYIELLHQHREDELVRRRNAPRS